MEEFLFFKTGKKYFKIQIDSILYIHAEKKNVSFVTETKCYRAVIPIGYVEKILPPKLFCRVHRSYIVSLKHTNEFDKELVYIRDKKIPIAEQYKNVLKSSILVVNGKKGPIILDGDVDKFLDDLNS